MVAFATKLNLNNFSRDFPLGIHMKDFSNDVASSAHCLGKHIIVLMDEFFFSGCDFSASFYSSRGIPSTNGRHLWPR